MMIQATTASKAAARQSASPIRLTLICVAMFFLYALGVLTLRQDRSPSAFNIEAGAAAVAVSYLVYGKPLGAYDSNVLRTFWERDKTSIQDVLLKAADGTIPHGTVELHLNDGIGVGSNLLATFAMWLFGIDLSSLVLFYLVFVGISVFTFVLRYRDARLLVVPLYLLTVTIMLLTPIGSSPGVFAQISIGGNRFFALAAFLPALHIFFEFVERYDPTTHKTSRFLLLLIQAILLFAALLVRSSASYLLVILFGAFLWRLYTSLRERNQLSPLAYKSAIVATALAFWAVFVVMALPAYVQTGRVLGNFWHRAFISLSFDPRWPFGDLQKLYDCTRAIPEGLNQLNADRNGHCIWIVYPPNKVRSDNEIIKGVYGGEYERALRDALFYVLTQYPKQAFETYIYFKSGQIKNTLGQALKALIEFGEAPVAKGLLVIVVVQLVLFISFVISLAAVGLTVIDPRLAIIPVLFLFSLAPAYVAWASLTTSVETIFLMYSCLALAALFAIQLALRRLPRAHRYRRAATT